jgi:hypothetical protein
MEAAAAPPAPPPPEQMVGPTPYTNWVLPNALLVGAHPRKREHIEAILSNGITVFVSLETQEEMDRSGKLYLEIANTICREKQASRSTKPSPAKGRSAPKNENDLEYIHLPIYDRGVAPDEDVRRLVAQILDRIQSGKRVYLHCRGSTSLCVPFISTRLNLAEGGHGRTGTIVSLILGSCSFLVYF